MPSPDSLVASGGRETTSGSTSPNGQAASGRVGRYLAALPAQEGRLALVTGANGALGLEIARHLAGRGAKVILTARSGEKGQRAREEVLTVLPTADVEAMTLDLGSLRSVREFTRQFTERNDRLDLLFLNAGVMAIDRRTTEDGFEMQFGVNHLGHFALAALLLPLVAASPGARIVTTTSGAALGGKVDFDDPMGERDYNRWRAYSQAKLANILFANALQRRMEAAGVAASAHSAHPGLVHTNLQRNASEAASSPLERFFLDTFTPLVGQGPAMGALPMVHAGLSERAHGGDLWGPRLFMARGAPVTQRQPRDAQDTQIQDRLWELSEELTGVEFGVSPA